MTAIMIQTPRGEARIHLHAARAARAALVLGHGAGGGVGAPDIVAVTEAAVASGITVALVEQPYRVAGRRAPAPAPHLDEAWIAVIEHLRLHELGDMPLVAGGRSMGGRVACRTSGAAGAVGVLCLAFPLQPPRRKDGTQPPDRLSELDAVTVPMLIVQGERDPFGLPPSAVGRLVVTVAGDHGLKRDMPAVTSAVLSWLGALPGTRSLG